MTTADVEGKYHMEVEVRHACHPETVRGLYAGTLRVISWLQRPFARRNQAHLFFL
ncbi:MULTISPECIES: hypothetical protein [unclassified Rhizobium]|jgi:hypothetical protein|uniref:hypothetical protein n=1 Tax=unclassified Rhizobium TaxID=2613769 RepID=UPI000A52A5CF|nr:MULTISPECIES: hypothetical protein [unclassified Rhizobium]RKD69229.1 hypothetical protein BJ928_104369 [Rhizobium sp. WW_1]